MGEICDTESDHRNCYSVFNRLYSVLYGNPDSGLSYLKSIQDPAGAGVAALYLGADAACVWGYFYNGDYERFSTSGMRTLNLALAIALGIIAVSTAVKMLTAIISYINSRKKGERKI